MIAIYCNGLVAGKTGQVGFVAPVARAKGVQLRSLPQMLRDTISGASVRDRVSSDKTWLGLDVLSTAMITCSRSLDPSSSGLSQSFFCFPRYCR